MNIIEKTVEYFSSDYNSGTLIYATPDGLIYNSECCSSPLISDTQAKKYVKFYPPDNRVITTTDPIGLRVWDAHRQTLLYQYRGDILSKHSYSEEYILSAFDTYNIKFYDLRCRYSIGTYKQGNIVDLGWIGSRIFTYDGDLLREYDYRNMEQHRSHGRADEFTISRSSCYFIRRNDNEHTLFRIFREGTSGDVIGKRVKYGKIWGIKEIDAFAYLEDGNIKIEEPGNIRKIKGDDKFKKIENIHIGDSKGFIFADSSLYEFNYEN